MIDLVGQRLVDDESRELASSSRDRNGDNSHPMTMNNQQINNNQNRSTINNNDNNCNSGAKHATSRRARDKSFILEASETTTRRLINNSEASGAPSRPESKRIFENPEARVQKQKQGNLAAAAASDGRRTLIKNQLYFIEQLQLENADLRHERDQLQLENEELKFQLQMISSSNINMTEPTSRENAPGVPFMLDQNARSTPFLDSDPIQATPTHRTTMSRGESLSLHGTPARHRVARGSGQWRAGNQRARQANGSVLVETSQRILHNNYNEVRLNQHELKADQHEEQEEEEEEEEGRSQMRLVEQRLGVEPERLQVAALIIQRAFRRHQICQRFRAITEQLRERGSSLDEHQRDSTLNPRPQVHALSRAAQQLIANTIEATSATTSSNQEGRDYHHHHRQATSATHSQFSPLASSIEQQSKSKPMISMHQIERHRALLYRVGLNIFNRSPEKGLSYFIAHKFIESSCGQSDALNTLTTNFPYHSNQMPHFVAGKSASQLSSNLARAAQSLSCQLCVEEENLKRNVADFLATRRGLAREKIGLYLGNLQEPFNQQVLKHYLQAIDFTGLEVDVALRKFLSGFRLPGEAQKIERLVENFATRYVESQEEVRAKEPACTETNNNHDNPSSSTSNIRLLNKDEIFILSFAIIMLNTDLHSPSLKANSRMSDQQFVNNLRGLFKSQPVKEGHLIDIYNRIKVNQISTIPDHMVNLVQVQRRLVAMANFQRKEIIPNICQPHRRMVCYCRVHELYDPQKKERAGQHQREVFLFNDLILVCKITNKRTIKANTQPPLVLRTSIPLQGLGVQLFQSTHYEFGIRLFQSSSNATVMMFNSVNKQDQVRFSRDLQDSIAEMREMEEIKNKNIVDLLHAKFLEKLRVHAQRHQEPKCDKNDYHNKDDYQHTKVTPTLIVNGNCAQLASKSMTDLRDTKHPKHGEPGACSLASLLDHHHQPKSFSSVNTSNSSDSGSSTKSATKKQQLMNQKIANTCNGQAVERKCSASSVFSHDSGMFLSREVSPNQSS